MNITDDFTLSEVTHTTKPFKNIPSPEQTIRIVFLVLYVLQPARTELKWIINVSNAFRCPQVNKAVGGVPDSQHLDGEAADISCQDNRTLFFWILYNTDFDQLIWEFGTDNQPQWLHVSYSMTNNRHNVLKSIKRGTKKVYIPFICSDQKKTEC